MPQKSICPTAENPQGKCPAISSRAEVQAQLFSRTVTGNTKSTPEKLKKQNTMKVLEWPNQSPDLKPTKILWHDHIVHAPKPSNVTGLK